MLYKRNIYIFLLFVSLSTGLFGETTIPQNFKTRGVFLRIENDTTSNLVKDPRFESGIQSGIGAKILAGIDLFSTVSISTDLQFLKINSSYPTYGIMYRGYTSASNDFRIDLYTNIHPSGISKSNLNTLIGIFGGWGYAFGSYTPTSILFYYTQLFGGLKLELTNRNHEFYSFVLEFPFTYQIRKDLQYSFGTGISIGITLYPILLF